MLGLFRSGGIKREALFANHSTNHFNLLALRKVTGFLQT